MTGGEVIEVVGTGGAVVDGMVVGGGVVGGAGATDVVGTAVGAGLGTVTVTSGAGTVVAGAGSTVAGVVARAGARVVTVGGTAVVVVVTLVVVEPDRSVGPPAPAARRSPTMTVDSGLSGASTVVGGRTALKVGGFARLASPEVAATMSTRTTTPTARPTKRLVRDVRLFAYHHCRSRSFAGGRPKAAFLPMDGGKR